MHRPPGARLALAVLCALAWAGPARAEGPLGPGAPCKTAQQVIDALAYQTGFAPAGKGCAKLCKQARGACAKHVNRAITCARKSVDDSTYFSIKVACEGEKGAALKQCKEPFEAGRNDDLAELEAERDERLGDCDEKAQDCAGACGDAP